MPLRSSERTDDPGPLALDAGPEPQGFAITATSSQIEATPRTLKHDDTFAVFDAHGDCVPGLASNHGIFHRDTRYLSHLFLSMEGMRPLLLSSTVREDNATLSCDLTNPDIEARDGASALLHDLIHIRRARFIYQSVCHERLSIHNFDVEPRRVEVTLSFAADFADLFEVRGAKRPRRGTLHSPQVSADTVRLGYTGLDDQDRTTVLRFEPVPDTLTADRASFVLTLEPGQTQVVFLEVRCNCEEPNTAPRRAFMAALRGVRETMRARTACSAYVITSNDHFNEGLRRAVSDVHVLLTETPEGLYPYAGVPWFSTVFGRDALITAFETLWMDPGIARGVLRHLAANQADGVDPAADAEPGKILHEVRFGEMAELGEVPFRRYYGSVDSTPLFVMLAGAYLERTGDIETARALWPNVERALAWIFHYGDRDGDGFVEYFRKTDQGLANQGWKDSYDSIFHADGALAVGPIALVEVQGYVYAALLGAAKLARRLDLPERAEDLEQRAARLRAAFDAAFFDDALGTYALALDGEKRPCRVRTSNAGHALFTGIALPERAGRVAETLMANASFSGWGVRTVAAGEARYNPMSYHNGSVWPHDNAIVALGLSRYGFRKEASRIFEGLFRASVSFDLRRLPELFCGFSRQRSQGPVSYPVACSPQAWAAATPLALLQAILGLGFDVDDCRVRFDRPLLPDFLDQVEIRRLSLDGGTLDVKLARVGAEAAVSVVNRTGKLGLRIEA